MVRNKRPRHHANPLAFTVEVAVPEWARVFADPTRPLEVDVGTAASWADA